MDKKTMIEKLMLSVHEKGGFTGAWLYAEKGVIVSKGAVGFRNAESTIPMREDSIFDIASVSKQFTAAAVMLLRRRGLLSLDDEVSRFFPEINYPGLTIRRLLNHTGGLDDYDDEMREIWEKEGRIPDNSAIIRILAENKPELLFVPGEQFSYSNSGYWLLAEIIEKAAGVKFEEFLKKEIFDPAGMEHTRVIHPIKTGEHIENLAVSMVLDDENGRFILPQDSQACREVIYEGDVNGDGNVHTNIFDLFKWDRVLHEGKLITHEEQAEMYAPTLLSNGEYALDDDLLGPVCYGFGWDVINDPEHGLIVCHSGYWPEYATWYERFIDEDKVIIKLSCRDQLDARANNALVPGLRAIAEDKEPEPVRSIEDFETKDPDRSRWESFCGKYEKPDDDLFVDEVFMKDNELFVKLMTDNGRTWDWKLYPLGGNEFGIKRYSFMFQFDDGSLTYGGYTCKKQ